MQFGRAAELKTTASERCSTSECNYHSAGRGRLPILGALFCILLVFGTEHMATASRVGVHRLQQTHQHLRRPGKLRLRLKEQASKHGEPRQQMLTFDQMAALRGPITVAVMTGHYFGSEYNRHVDNCTLVGVPLDCTFFPKSSEPLSGDLAEVSRSADAVWWHAPNSCNMQKGPWDVSEDSGFSPFKARPDQLAVIASMESSSYYKCLDDEAFMSNFDVEMTYRRQSGVPLLYWGNGYRETWEKVPPLPLAQKKDAVVFINSNCQAPSGRTEIVKGLIENGITVDALGSCLNSEAGKALPRGAAEKFESFRRYKYCIAIENSIANDYVTEKVYDALAAGCVPIYLGAPNIVEFVPTLDSIIDYQQLGSPEALAGELRRLSADDVLYLDKLSFRGHPETWGKEFSAIAASAAQNVHTQCQLCQVIGRHRVNMPDPNTGKVLNVLRQPLNRTRTTPHIQPRLLEIKFNLVDAAPATMEQVTGRWT